MLVSKVFQIEESRATEGAPSKVSVWSWFRKQTTRKENKRSLASDPDAAKSWPSLSSGVVATGSQHSAMSAPVGSGWIDGRAGAGFSTASGTGERAARTVITEYPEDDDDDELRVSKSFGSIYTRCSKTQQQQTMTLTTTWSNGN